MTSPIAVAQAQPGLQQLVTLIAQAMVDLPDAVAVNVLYGEASRSMFIELDVASTDVGKIIGRQGQNIKALRQIVDAAATKLRIKAILRFAH